MLADVKPAFVGFPGGCFIEGNRLPNAVRWKDTIGPWEERPGHYGDVWDYWTDDGLWHLEFLQLAEDLGALPIWVFNNGDDELLSGEAEKSIPSPAKRKKLCLPSLENKGNASSPYSFGRNREQNERKVFPCQGSDSPVDKPKKSVDGRSEGSRLSINLNKSAQYNKQFCAGDSSKQQIPRKGRERTQRINKQIGSVSNLLKPLTEAANIRNLRSCDVATRPTRKKALEVLTIDHCTSLESLPTELGNIQSLRNLNAYGLNVSKVPNSIRRLSKLVELNLRDSKYLKTLPHTICNLRALEILNILGCSSLEALPTALGNIKSLRELDLEGLTVSKLPDSIGHLSKLVELYLRGNKNLETLPDTICNLRSLKILDISRCDKLEILPNLSNLKQLEKFFLIDYSGLTVVLGLGNSLPYKYCT